MEVKDKLVSLEVLKNSLTDLKSLTKEEMDKLNTQIDKVQTQVSELCNQTGNKAIAYEIQDIQCIFEDAHIIQENDTIYIANIGYEGREIISMNVDNTDISIIGRIPDKYTFNYMTFAKISGNFYFQLHNSSENSNTYLMLNNITKEWEVATKYNSGVNITSPNSGIVDVWGKHVLIYNTSNTSATSFYFLSDTSTGTRMFSSSYHYEPSQTVVLNDAIITPYVSSGYVTKFLILKYPQGDNSFSETYDSEIGSYNIKSLFAFYRDNNTTCIVGYSAKEQGTVQIYFNPFNESYKIFECSVYNNDKEFSSGSYIRQIGRYIKSYTKVSASTGELYFRDFDIVDGLFSLYHSKIRIITSTGLGYAINSSGNEITAIFQGGTYFYIDNNSYKNNYSYPAFLRHEYPLKTPGNSSVTSYTFSYNFSSVVSYYGDLYVLGGYNGTSGSTAFMGYINDLAYVYKNLPYEFRGGSAAVYNNAIRIIGGFKSFNNTAYSYHYYWNLSDWIKMPDTPYPIRDNLLIGTSKGLYLFGGRVGVRTTDFYVYTEETALTAGTYTQKHSLPKPSNAYNSWACNIGDDIYLFYNDGDYYKYDVINDKWIYIDNFLIKNNLPNNVNLIRGFVNKDNIINLYVCYPTSTSYVNQIVLRITL